MIKRAAKKILEATGFELRRINNKFEPKKEDTFKWMRNLNIRTVFDVGANTGQFAGEIHAILPEAAIYSFEPLPALRMHLESYKAEVDKIEAELARREAGWTPSDDTWNEWVRGETG